MTTIGFRHTASVHVDTFTRLLADADPSALGRHVVGESLLADARASGVDDALRARLLAQLRSVGEVDTILCTCSTIGGAAESLALEVGVDVLRVDRPMARAAVGGGGRIGIVAALASTLAPTRALLQEEADAAGAAVELMDLPCLDTWRHFEAGDHDAFLDAIAAHVDALAADVDVVVLAQASMAGAVTRCSTDRPVLASPTLAIDAVLTATA